MTVIAYRKGVIAADSLRTSNDGAIDYLDKLALVRQAGTNEQAVIGIAGDTDDTHYLTQWWIDGAHPGDFPDKLKDDSSFIYIMKKDALYAVMARMPRLVAKVSDRGYEAGGSGGPFARGAMAAGCSPAEAVKAAIVTGAGCGGDVVEYRYSKRKGFVKYRHRLEMEWKKGKKE